MTDAAGVTTGMRWNALDAVGLYVPGGKAAYPSSVLMNAIPARTAGVARIAMCVPTPDGVLNPLVLAAARRAGVTEIYRVGGAQAVAALAYGTASIPPVDRIVGPGNAYVAEAKRQVFGRVGIDSIAGPSEVVVLADADNDPRRIAVDLLAQAEHDEAAQSILITDDATFADAVAAAVLSELPTLPRATIAGASWQAHGAIILVPGRGVGRPSGTRTSATDAARPRGRFCSGAPRRRGVPRRLLPGSRGGLRRRTEPCAADGTDRPVCLGAIGVRFLETNDVCLGDTGCAGCGRTSGRDLG
jgi:hypothetical protein